MRDTKPTFSPGRFLAVGRLWHFQRQSMGVVVVLGRQASGLLPTRRVPLAPGMLARSDGVQKDPCLMR
jgi:hypothetical protein